MDPDRTPQRASTEDDAGSPSEAPRGGDDEPAPRTARKKKGRADWYQKTSAASLGIEMAIAIVLCTFAGLWLQNNVTHWQPWTMLIGFAFGVGAAVNAIIRVIREEEAARLEREAARHAAEGRLDGEASSPVRDATPRADEREGG